MIKQLYKNTNTKFGLDFFNSSSTANRTFEDLGACNFHNIGVELLNIWWLICAMSYYRVFGAKRRHAKTLQKVTFSSFRMATFRPAIRKYDTFHASPFRLLFFVSLPGGAKGRHAKTRQNHLLACFRVATFRVFAPENTFIRHNINQPPYKPEYRTRILAIMCTCAPRYFDTHLSENNIVLLLL